MVLWHVSVCVPVECVGMCGCVYVFVLVYVLGVCSKYRYGDISSRALYEYSYRTEVSVSILYAQ